MEKSNNLDGNVETDGDKRWKANKPTAPSCQSSHHHILIIPYVALIRAMNRIAYAIAKSTDESSHYLENENSFEIAVKMFL